MTQHTMYDDSATRWSTNDPLRRVLSTVRLRGAYFYMVQASAPWALLTASARDLLPRVVPEAPHLINVLILLTGSCWTGVRGEPQVHMQPGDVVVLPRGDSHLMGSAPGVHADVAHTGIAPQRYPDTVYLGHGFSRDATFVCGLLGCDALQYNPLLAALPSLLLMRSSAASWLSHFPMQLVTQSRCVRAGGEAVLTRMAEVLFLEVVRQHVESLPAQSGWLKGIRDGIVGAALAALHARPTHHWTLAELAQTVAASRSVLVERFTQLVGVSPMLYLMRWRLQLASTELANGTAKIAAIGAQAGYESEAAFSRAFKREVGVSPSQWRRSRQSR